MILPILFEGLALVGGTVHTLEPGATASVATIVIEDGRIVAVGPDVEVPQGARTVDCTGQHLIPGLIDGMVHHDPDHDVLYIANGVTLVRDAGNDLARILEQRSAAARERGPGPDLLICGAVLDGVPPATTESVVLTTVAEVEDKLPRLVELGVDYLSMHLGLTPEIWARTVEVAHEHGLELWGPVPGRMELLEVVGPPAASTVEPPPRAPGEASTDTTPPAEQPTEEPADGPAGESGAAPATADAEVDYALRQDGLFYLDSFLGPDRSWLEADVEALGSDVTAVAAAGTKITPLLAVWGTRLVPPGKDQPALKWLGPVYTRLWRADMEARATMALEDPARFGREGLAIVDTQGALMRRLHAAGVRLVPGSAAPHPWLLPGEALLQELSLWKRAGFSPEEILHAATVDAARNLGVGDERGTLAPDKIADVVILSGDPLEELGHLHSPEGVVVRGRYLSRSDLDGLLDDLATRQAERRAAADTPIVVAAPELPDGDPLLSGLAETWAADQRLSAERFAVVREYDGTFAYCGRVRTPGGASTPDTELVITQRIRDGAVVGLRLVIKSGRRSVVVRGEYSGDRLQLERRVDGAFVDNVRLSAAVALVEAGSVTSSLILGRDAEVGKLSVLFFEDTEPAVGHWELALDDSNTHLLRTPTGERLVRFDPRGFPVQALRQEGRVIFETRTMEVETYGGPGLPLPRDKTPKALEASAPTTPAEAGDGAAGPAGGGPR